MLATLAVVLWAYGMYALFSYIFHRQGGYVRSHSRWRKIGKLVLMGGVSAGVGLIFWCSLYPDKHDQRLRLAGFLGTVYAEGWPDRVDRLKDAPVKKRQPGSVGAAGLCPAASGDAGQSGRPGKETSQAQAEPGCFQGATCSPPG